MKSQTKTFPFFFLHCSLFICLFASCADMFQEKISSSGKNNSLDNFFNTGEEISKLQQPGQFYAAPYFSSTEIRLSWTEVRGAAYYMIERAAVSPVPESIPPVWKEPDEEDYDIMNRFVYGTSFTDIILKSPALDAPEYQNKYFYRVSAFNTAKKYDESDPTEPVSSMLFRAPGNLKASGGVSEDYVELLWERSAGADSYEIWRSEFPSGASASFLGTVRGNQTWFQNRVSAAEQGKNFYYMITALNGFGNKSLQTKPAYGYARVFGSPDAPFVRLASGSGRGHSVSSIKIEWDAADEPDAYYAVYRYSNIDSSLTRLAEKIENKTEYVDNIGLKTGVYYYYKVQAIVDDIASGKALKSQFSFSDPQGFILSPPDPDTVAAEKSSDGSIIVKWKPAIGSEGERAWYSYNVYADTRMDGDFLSCVAVCPPNTDAEGYICAEGLSLSNGTFFKVSTVNLAVPSDNESVKSIMVSPAPAAAIIMNATQYGFISQNTTANSSGVYPVVITWKKPANENPAFYHIQRSTKAGTGFSRINETALNANGQWSDIYYYDPATEVYTFIDRNETAKVGRKYWYRVLSLNQLEQGSFPSDEKIGWGALTHTQYMIEYNKTMKSALKKLTYMHKSGSTEKLGTETKYGTISGSIYYDAAISGLGARIIIKLDKYADFYIENDPDKGVYFTLSGNSNTTANMSSNGDMDGTVTCTGMYPGKVYYDKIQIKGGAAGGGTYGIHPDNFQRSEVSWTVGEQ
jgi:hypothetical protein